MVAFTTLLSLAASAPLLAVSSLAVKRDGCSLSGVQLSGLPSPLVAPTTPASFVGIAIGTQNYTCNTAGTYTNVGALAELFDASCLYNSKLFSALPSIVSAAWSVAPPEVPVSQIISTLHGISTPAVLGQHYYVLNPLTGVGINPKWDFTSSGADAGKSDAFVVAAKVNGASAPTGSQDIDWVQLGALTGDLAKQVYRVQTRLGQPPASCTPGSNPIQVKYTALYYGFGGNVTANIQ